MKQSKKAKYTLANSKYALLGVVSPLKGHRMAMSFNSDLGFNFQQALAISYPPQDDSPINFPMFSYEDENNTTLFRLITNRAPNGILVYEFKEFDFLVQIEGDYAESFANRLLSSLKQNDSVLASGLLSTKKIKRILMA